MAVRAGRGTSFVRNVVTAPIIFGTVGMLAHIAQDGRAIPSASTDDAPADWHARIATSIHAADFQIVSIRPVTQPDGSVIMDLPINEQSQRVHVRPHRIRASGFQLTASTRDTRQYRQPTAPHTYRGTVLGRPESSVALSILDDAVTGVIDDGASLRWLQPASRFTKHAPDDAHILMNQADLTAIPGQCGTDLMGLVPAPTPLAAEARGGGGSCLSAVEIAIDCDYEFWELEGFSEETLVNDVEAVINAMDVIYRHDTGITYVITSLNYWTDQLGDPYIATQHSAMLGEFKSWWNANEGGVQRDVAHLMTGKEIDGSVIGVAYLGVICDLNDAYGLSQSLYTNDFSRRVALTSHELGHNWNACHCNQGGCTGGGADPDCGIMCSSISGCTQTHDMFNQRTIDAITAWRDASGCLSAADTVSVAIARLPAATPGMDDEMGASVALSGEWAVVGAPRDDELANDAGAAYVFKLDAGVWMQMQKLTASDAAAGDLYGFSVDVDDDLLIIGAPLKTRVNGNLSQLGAAYVYKRVGDVWTFDEKIDPADGAANDQFGTSVSVNGSRVAIGAYLDDDLGNASGSAYVYWTNGTNWFLDDKLTASDGSPNDQFGINVEIAADDVIVGSWRDDAPEFDSGSAYVFNHDGVAWTEQGKLLSPDANIVDQFGRVVAIFGDTALVGAPGDDEAGSEWGAAYTFTRSGSTWSFDDKLMPSLVSDIGQFGTSVAIEQSTALIGAWRDNLNTDDAGSAFLFERQLGWIERDKLTAPAEENLEKFGASVALGGGVVLIGATQSDGTDTDSGSAYASATTTSTEDCNENGTADGCEISLGFAADVNTNGIPDDCECLADVDLDGQVAVQDLLSILSAWGNCPAPCPPLCIGDIDGNCLVNVNDLLNVLSNWGACPNAAPVS